MKISLSVKKSNFYKVKAQLRNMQILNVKIVKNAEIDEIVFIVEGSQVDILHFAYGIGYRGIILTSPFFIFY